MADHGYTVGHWTYLCVDEHVEGSMRAHVHDKISPRLEVKVNINAQTQVFLGIRSPIALVKHSIKESMENNHEYSI